MKRMPPEQIQLGSEQAGQGGQEESPEEAIDEIKKLDELEGKIEKEKERLKKDVIEKEKKTSKSVKSKVKTSVK